ncbi:hypothetical protein E4T56_gene6568, partial [Termitomyces sp. T112]
MAFAPFSAPPGDVIPSGVAPSGNATASDVFTISRSVLMDLLQRFGSGMVQMPPHDSSLTQGSSTSAPPILPAINITPTSPLPDVHASHLSSTLAPSHALYTMNTSVVHSNSFPLAFWHHPPPLQCLSY